MESFTLGSEEQMTRLPLLASGKLGADYELLFAYWEIAKEEGKGGEKDVVLRKEDLEMVEELASRKGKIMLEEIVSASLPIVLKRIDPQIAKKAYERVHGVEVPQDFAAIAIAKVIVLWIVEALEIEGKLNL
ncbi:MAG: hypothetical protein C0179_07925 [Fervidicoccus sp.]|nr:MAG: hypothetical protein C0179_07925 [Fervidicoccus sp.]